MSDILHQLDFNESHFSASLGYYNCNWFI